MFRWRLVCLALVLPFSSGCALWHELQPHRLHRLNRVPAPHLDPEFSQTDRDAAIRLVGVRQTKFVIARPSAERWFQAAAVVEF